jgi:hypothetical protein
MSSDFMRRLEAKGVEDTSIPEHVIWRLTKNGRLAGARMRIVATPEAGGLHHRYDRVAA